jgi:hypothetical protein
MENTKETFKAKMETQLKEWSARLDTLQAKAEKAGADTKKELLAELAELEKLQAAGQKHLATVATAAADAWGALKTDVAAQWDHVAGAADALWSRVSSKKPTG